MAIKFQPTRAATLAVIPMLAVLLALGFWQVERLEWKTAYLAEIGAQMEKEPVPLPEEIAAPQEWKFRRVTLAGEFLRDHVFLVKPRTMDGVNGYHMVVPFRRASGGVVFVNRGWISDELMDKASWPEGLTRIEGIVQLPERTGWTPANTAKDWYWADIPAMAKAAGIGKAAPLLVHVAVRTPGVWPAGGRLQLDIPNDHRQYALFWFSMAGVLLVIYILRGMMRVSGR